MANHKSARKRARQSIKRRARNRHVKTTVRSALKTARTSAEAGDKEQGPAAIRRAESLLRRAASKGVIPAKRASRLVSRLNKAANKS
ncbi:MAG: 30S ribosomal protein S20 [Myxococcota bacterium]|nr:30S ribosomal protein S20 [Myxococcota bacterium]